MDASPSDVGLPLPPRDVGGDTGDVAMDASLDTSIEMGLPPVMPDAMGPNDAALGQLDASDADAVLLDSAMADVRVDEIDAGDLDELDEGMSPPQEEDGAVPFPADAAPAAPDAISPSDDAALDGHTPDAEVASSFVSGDVRAMDGVTPVRVRVGELAVAAADGRFRIGPLAAGRYVVVVEAEGHQSETVVVEVAEDEEIALEDEVVLFRGRKIGAGDPQRFLMSGDGRWLLWVADEAVFGVETASPRVTRYVADGFEVFFGFDAARDVFHLRRRARPGIAGDIVEVSLREGRMTTLFVEAQPWLGRVGGRYLAMVETRAAHSRLEARGVDQPAIVLGEGVPWLGVTTLSDGQLAWTTQREDGYAVWRGAADGAVALRVEARNVPATNDFLMRIWPDGLAWRGVDGGLWRWADDTDVLIEDIAPRPLPRFLSVDEVLAWRPDAVGHTVLHHRDGETRPLVSGVATQPFLERGRFVYAHRVGEGLWIGHLDDADPGLVIPGLVESLVMVGEGVLALVDGAVWRWTLATGAERLAGPAVSDLSYAPGGATAWQREEGRLLYFGAAGAPVTVVENAPVERPVRASGEALYVRGAETHAYVTLPDAANVPFDRRVERLTVLNATDVLGVDEDATLWAIHGPTGISRGWAEGVTRVAKSANGAVVAYACARGIFMVSPAP